MANLNIAIARQGNARFRLYVVLDGTYSAALASIQRVAAPTDGWRFDSYPDLTAEEDGVGFVVPWLGCRVETAELVQGPLCLREGTLDQLERLLPVWYPGVVERWDDRIVEG